MKRFALFALVSLVSVGAFATSPMPNTVAEIVTFGGFAPAAIPAHGVRVLNSGAVVAFEGEKVEAVAQLDEETLAGLENLGLEIAKIDGEVIDLDADKPICMDAPSTSIQIHTLGIAIETGARHNCHDYQLQKDGYTPYEVSRLNQIMEGLQALASLRK